MHHCLVGTILIGPSHPFPHPPSAAFLGVTHPLFHPSFVMSLHCVLVGNRTELVLVASLGSSHLPFVPHSALVLHSLYSLFLSHHHAPFPSSSSCCWNCSRCVFIDGGVWEHQWNHVFGCGDDIVSSPFDICHGRVVTSNSILSHCSLSIGHVMSPCWAVLSSLWITLSGVFVFSGVPLMGACWTVSMGSHIHSIAVVLAFTPASSVLLCLALVSFTFRWSPLVSVHLESAVSGFVLVMLSPVMSAVTSHLTTLGSYVSLHLLSLTFSFHVVHFGLSSLRWPRSLFTFNGHRYSSHHICKNCCCTCVSCCPSHT